MKTNFGFRLVLVGLVIVALVAFAQAPVAAQVPTSLPTAPVITGIVPESNSATVTWDDLANDEVGYYVYYSSNGSQWLTAGNLPADSTSIEITGLACSKSYMVIVQAYNGSGSASDDDQFTTSPCKLFLPLALR